MLTLAAVVIASTGPGWSGRLLDAHLHVNCDTANFLRRAVHSADPHVPDWRTVFGVSRFGYAIEGGPVPTSRQHYGNHGVLQPMLVTAWVRLLGPGEATIRSLHAILTVAAVLLLYGIVRVRISPLWATLVCGVFLAVPIRVLYADAFKYESGSELAILGLTWLLVRCRRRCRCTRTSSPSRTRPPTI